MATFSLTNDQFDLIAYAYYLGVDKKNFIPIYLIRINATFDELKGNTIALGSLYDGSDNVLPFSDSRFQNTSWFTTYGKNKQVYNSFFPDWNDGILSVDNVLYTDSIERIYYYHKVSIIPKNYTFSTNFYSAVYSPSLASKGRYDGSYSASLLFLWVAETSDGQYFTTSNPANIVIQNNNTGTFDTSGLPPIILADSTTKGSLVNTTHIVFNLEAVDDAKTSGEAIAYLLGLSKRLTPNDPKDPNDGDGDSKGGGGGGDGDIGGYPHKKGETPTISALDSGLITLYNPTVSQLQELGKFLWSDSFDVNSFKKLLNDPFDTLLGLSIVPILPTAGGTHNIFFGNMDSGISCKVVSNQWVPIDCGDFTLNEVWKGALDYSPSTQVSIYLPFIGVRQLNVNDVMGSTLHLYYNFDLLTGSCVAEITINHSSQGNKTSGFYYNADMGSVYTFIGQCAVNIPLSSMDFTNTIRAAISGVAVATGAAASCATGNPALGISTLMVGTAQAGMQANTPTVERSGHLSSASALLASLEPCLFIQRPHICKPNKYYALRGVPSQVYVSNLSSCTGYFQISDVQNIHASGATDSELEQIKSLLLQGVFVDKWASDTVTKESTLKLTLYNNKSAKNKIDKNITEVRDDNIIDGIFKDSCDIENPVIRIKINDVSSLNNLNYMYIGIFQRYYYITKITSMRNHIVEITGHVDVLMTYAHEIGQNTAILARSSQVPAYGNTYLDDNELATYSDTYNVSYPWGYSFSHDNDSLLAVAGASQS